MAVVATSDACHECPTNSNAPEASDEEVDCTCNAGSTGPDGGNCTQCEAGKYKVASGDAACTICSAGQYLTAVGATSNVCHERPTNSNAPEASDEEVDCTCNAGSMGLDGGNCTQCEAGKYKVASGDAACTNCSAGQYSEAVGATSDVCLVCTTNSNAPEESDEEVDCTCNAGSSGLDGGMRRDSFVSDMPHSYVA